MATMYNGMPQGYDQQSPYRERPRQTQQAAYGALDSSQQTQQPEYQRRTVSQYQQGGGWAGPQNVSGGGQQYPSLTGEQQSQTPPGGQPTTPVTANGLIQPYMPPQQGQPQQMRSSGQYGGINPGGMYNQPGYGQQGVQGVQPSYYGYYQPQQPSYVPGQPPTAASGTAAFTGGLPGGMPLEGIYQPDQLSPGQAPTYNPYSYNANPTATLFNSPDQSASNAQQLALVQQLLSNPNTVNPALLKESQKETALSMQQQLGQQLGQSAASRGVYGGGTNAVDAAQLGQNTNEQLLKAYRDIDMQAAQQNQASQLAALQGSEAILGGQAGRSTGLYGAGLQGQQALFGQQMAGQQAQAGENQLGYQSQNQAWQNYLNQQMQQAGLNQAGAASWQAAYGQDVARANQAAQNALQGQSIGNQYNLGRYNVGLGYAQLQQQGQNQLLNYLLNGGGMPNG